MRLLGLVTLAIVAAGQTARAQPAIITIRGDICEPGALDSELSDMLTTRAVGDARVSVVMRGGADSLSADVLFEDANGDTHGPRVVTAATCDDLFDSIAVVIAMALPEPRAPAVQPPAPPPAEPARPAAPPPVADKLSIERSSATATSAAVSLDGYIGGATAVTSRGVTEQVMLGARVKRGGASIALQARASAPDNVPVTATGTITVSEVDATLAPCLHLGPVAGCALLTAGWLRGRGDALEGARAAVTPVLAGGVRIGWEHVVTNRLTLAIHLDGRALLTTTTFDVDFMPVWQSSRFEGSAGLGLLARFL